MLLIFVYLLYFSSFALFCLFALFVCFLVLLFSFAGGVCFLVLLGCFVCFSSFAFGLAGVFCLLLEITMNFNYFLEIVCKINDISSYYGYLYKKYYIGLTFFNMVTTMSSNTYV